MNLPAIFSEAWIHALGWTVVHSLWQAGLAGLTLAIVLAVLQRRPAEWRYAAAVATQLLILLAAVVTFFQLYEPQAAVSMQVEGQTGPLAAFWLNEADPANWLDGWRTAFIAYFDRHLPLIVMVWLIGVLLFTLRLLGAWAYAQRLTLVAVQPASEAWQQRLQDLARRLRLDQAVSLMESAVVQTPMVIGHFKPVILIPLGLLSGLPPAQIEAILAHELAHIRRRDYLVNILLSVLETLLFFNPAIWWISAAIRREREYCCDEVAVKVCGDALTYAKALAGLQELRMAAPVLAMAAAGKRKELLCRVRRILQQPNNSSDVMEKFTATLLIFLSVLFLSMRADESRASEPSMDDLAWKMSTGQMGMAQDTLPPGRITLSANKNGKKIEARIEGRQIQELKVDGAEIPAEQYGQYKKDLEELLQHVPEPPAPPVPPRAGMPFPPVPPVPPAPPAPGARGRFFFFDGEDLGQNDVHIRIDDGDTAFVWRDRVAPRAFFWPRGHFDRDFNGLMEFRIDSAFKFNFELNEKLMKEFSDQMGKLNQDVFLFQMDSLPEGFKFDIQIDEKRMQEMSEDMRKQAEEMAKRFQEQQGRYEFRQREMEDRMRERQHDMQRRLERDLIQEGPRWEMRIPAPEFYDGSPTKQRIERSLLQDQLIDEKGRYSFELTDRYLKINGKKQPENIFKKYRKLYEDVSGMDLGERDRVTIEKEVDQAPRAPRMRYYN